MVHQRNPVEFLDRLTLEWYFAHASGAVSVGFLSRWFEHAMWASDAKNKQTRMDVLRWGLVSLPQCTAVGFAVGYILVAIVANTFQSQTIVDVCGYCIPGIVSFLAADLRELLRRWSGGTG
jgi:hypothetical protein